MGNDVEATGKVIEVKYDGVPITAKDVLSNIANAIGNQGTFKITDENLHLKTPPGQYWELYISYTSNDGKKRTRRLYTEDTFYFGREIVSLSFGQEVVDTDKIMDFLENMDKEEYPQIDSGRFPPGYTGTQCDITYWWNGQKMKQSVPVGKTLFWHVGQVITSTSTDAPKVTSQVTEKQVPDLDTHA